MDQRSAGVECSWAPESNPTGIDQTSWNSFDQPPAIIDMESFDEPAGACVALTEAPLAVRVCRATIHALVLLVVVVVVVLVPPPATDLVHRVHHVHLPLELLQHHGSWSWCW